MTTVTTSTRGGVNAGQGGITEADLGWGRARSRDQKMVPFDGGRGDVNCSRANDSGKTLEGQSEVSSGVKPQKPEEGTCVLQKIPCFCVQNLTIGSRKDLLTK